jgi:hypothetical protein
LSAYVSNPAVSLLLAYTTSEIFVKAQRLLNGSGYPKMAGTNERPIFVA